MSDPIRTLIVDDEEKIRLVLNVRGVGYRFAA
jgi:DNA-binding response OmpR family regulator